MIWRSTTLFAVFWLAAQLVGAAPVDPEAWRNPVPNQPEVLVVRNATIWTGGPQGVLESSDLLIRRGRIVAVGANLDIPEEAMTIDAAGRHVTPGLIDAHSHVAVRGSVNDSSNIVTAEVRIADVLDPEDINIYRQLAGGLTAANVLHGSANAIGGQNAIIKLK